MNWRGVFLCVVGVASFAPIATAEEEREKRALIEEFLTAEPSYVQLKGEIELSSALDYRRPAGNWGVPVLVEYGITDRIEAEVEASYLSVRGNGSRNRGPGDVELGLHYALRPDVDKVAVTLGADVGLATGDEAKGLGSGQSDVEFFGIAGMKLGRAELHVTGRLEVEEEEVQPAMNAAAVYPHGDLRFTLEANVLSGAERTKKWAVEQQVAEKLGKEKGSEDLWVVVTPGLFHRPSSEIEYGIGVPIGLTKAAPDWGIIARLTIEFEF
jgi:hypothetical protein